MSHTPDPRAVGISINDYCALLPKQRYSHEARGRVLLLPSSGLVVVPFNEHTGGWDVVVVEGFGSYPVGGYHLSVGDAEIETAIELALGEPVPVRYVGGRKEADLLPDGTFILTRAGHSLRKETDDTGTIWTGFLKTPARTPDLDDALFPAKIRDTVPQSSGNAGPSPKFVYSREEAEALPDRESILTPGGIVFRKWVGYYREGQTTWCRFMHDPITTDLLDKEMHFPAKVLGTTYAEAPEQKKASRV